MVSIKLGKLFIALNVSDNNNVPKSEVGVLLYHWHLCQGSRSDPIYYLKIICELALGDRRLFHTVKKENTMNGQFLFYVRLTKRRFVNEH